MEISVWVDVWVLRVPELEWFPNSTFLRPPPSNLQGTPLGPKQQGTDLNLPLSLVPFAC